MDGDSLTNFQEFQFGTDPTISDTDEDGLSDGDEINFHSSNPLLLDSDGDGYEDAEEVSKGSSPSDPLSLPPVVNLPPTTPTFVIRNCGWGINGSWIELNIIGGFWNFFRNYI